MSTTKTFADKLKTAPVATSLPSVSVLCVNSLGALSKTNPQNLAERIYITKPYEDIDSLVTPGLYSLTDISTGTFPGGLSRCRWSMLEVFLRGTDVYQRLTDVTFMAIRRCSQSTIIWCPWREVTFVASAT